ncbi:MAG: hypothetical protein HC927_01475 [Deltaproteobacteria bacterium]|nr:hypothetical protein [Deltaproteobacteria bacterium]
MSCQQANYSLTVGGPIDPQDLSFELNSSITVTFVAPSGYSVTGVNFSPNPPSTGPTPSTTTDTITFSDPNFATVDFDVTVTHTGPPTLGLDTPTTVVKFKPRSRCPTQ